ncbi:kinase-like domain-containing protein [Rhizophagus clarus]|uniref:Kinase-like domain-containing protein n=1 Tax=Rhizophagus clarus TaxID=94130 RepID=A0A8H3LMC0_9GLOM|nr:kinase-like domain-containing protein [Rhizophagus clarus]
MMRNNNAKYVYLFIRSKVIGNPDDWINWIEESIAKKQIKNYDYKHFNNIQEIGFGRFGNVYRAKWKNSRSYLALKSFINFNNVVAKKIVDELKCQREVDFYENIIQFYGITTESKNDNPKEYLLIMEYADSGTLRSYLNERSETLTWNYKLNLALQLANAISCLHNEEIVHLNLHPNNILVHKNIIKLADFGLSKKIKESFNFQSNLFKVSDIYSIGIIFWEISSGRPPFCNESYDIDLAKEIVHGLRENPILNTPEDYIKIYTGCWNNDPDNRPTIEQVIMRLNTIIPEENVQLSSKKQNIFEIPKNIVNDSLQEEMSQVIQYFNKLNIKEMEPSVSLDNDFDIRLFSFLKIQFGIGINIDKQKAFELYQKAANSGNVFGISSLGYCYSNEIGTSFNDQKVFELYQKAVNLGNTRGICNLGYCYENGIGTCVNKQKAFKLYQKAANLGSISVRGINNLGGCYYDGIGTNIDRQKAFELYRGAAILGDSLAQYNLASMYEDGEVKKDINQAIYWYNKSAEQGDKHAQMKLNELTNEKN